ncbi:MAG: AI-2E family transporter [Gammaproteobacteria bacterium]
MLTGIFSLLVLYTLYIAAPLFVPMALAFLLNLLFAPLVRRLARVHVPPSVGAAFVLLALLGVVGGGAYLLSAPAAVWLDQAPQVLQEVEGRLSDLRQPIESMRRASERVEEMTTADDDGVQTVEVRRPSILEFVLGGTPEVLASAALVFFLLYFLLAAGDDFLLKLVKMGANLEQKKRVVGVMRDIQSDISHYLLTITVVNCCLGLIVALALFALGVPNPLLWGTMVALLNFAPYIGAAVSIVVLTLVGLLTFDSLGHALLVPLTFFVITTIEGQLVTPIVVGYRLELSAIVVFLAVVICGWMWGIIGALFAVPLIASLRIVCSYVQPLRPVAELLGTNGRDENQT